MGLPMAENLSNWLKENQLPPLTVWNRTPTKLPEASESLLHGESLHAMGKKLDIIFTSLGSDEAAQDVYDELFEGAQEAADEAKAKGEHPPARLFVDVSTFPDPWRMIVAAVLTAHLLLADVDAVPEEGGLARAAGEQDCRVLLPAVPRLWPATGRAGRGRGVCRQWRVPGQAACRALPRAGHGQGDDRRRV